MADSKLRRAWTWLSRASTAWGLAPVAVTGYVTGILYAALAVVAGYLEHQAIIWIIVAVPITIAAVLSAFVRALDLYEKTSPANMFRFVGLVIGTDVKATLRAK